jgi:transposase
LHALGRSRGGYGTKACAVCDAQARPLGFALIPGQASELRAAPELLLLAALLGTVRRVVCDAAYSSVAWFALVMEAGALPVVRSNPTHPQQDHFDRAAYRRRHKVENLWAKLKEWRAIATRYDKTAKSFSGGLYLAAAFQWLS